MIPTRRQRGTHIIDEPIGHAIADAVRNDLVRGVIATDALIGTFARLDDPSLRQNICFLYHVLGGDWNVPVGGMGSVTAALAAAAVGHGAEITTGADVYAVDPDGEVRYRSGDDEHRIRGRFVLAGVTPAVLAGLLGERPPPLAPGSQVKVNMVLRRLPRLRDKSVTPGTGIRRDVSTSTRRGPNWIRRTHRRPRGNYRIRCPARPTAIR